MKNISERCRAFLSNYRDEDTGKLVFEGRGNLGAISLHLPMIYQKAKLEQKEFFDVLYEYLEIIRKLHKKRFDYVGKAKASSNPLLWMCGGAYKGNLEADDNISEILKSFTISFGVTALNELCRLHNGSSIKDDNKIAVETMQFITNYIEKIKEEDGILYAIYGTPAESLAGLQVRQFRDMYGEIKGVSDKEYVSNSFHIHVSESVTPYEKQNAEEELFKYFTGGHIQYGKFGNPSNKKALKSFILRGLEKDMYIGVNFGKCTCEDCGHEFIGSNEKNEQCPHCNSYNITEVVRINGYMGYKTVKGDTTLNDSKLAELEDRDSM